MWLALFRFYNGLPKNAEFWFGMPLTRLNTPIPASFCFFSSFNNPITNIVSISTLIIEKSLKLFSHSNNKYNINFNCIYWTGVDVLGIRTYCRRMVGEDRSTKNIFTDSFSWFGGTKMSFCNVNIIKTFEGIHAWITAKHHYSIVRL